MLPAPLVRIVVVVVTPVVRMVISAMVAVARVRNCLALNVVVVFSSLVLRIVLVVQIEGEGDGRRFGWRLHAVQAVFRVVASPSLLCRFLLQFGVADVFAVTAAVCRRERDDDLRAGVRAADGRGRRVHAQQVVVAQIRTTAEAVTVIG